MDKDYIYEGMQLYNLQGRVIIVEKIEWINDLKEKAYIYGKFKEEQLSENFDRKSNKISFTTPSLGKYLFYEKSEIGWKDNIEILRTHSKYTKYSEEVKKYSINEKVVVNELDKFHNYLENNYDFEGFIHTTNFSNFINIMKSGYIYSRIKVEREGLLSIDSADSEIIQGTSSNVQNKVRFYFRPKTPTHYRNEGINPNIPEHHMPIPVMLVLGRNIYFEFNGIFTDGNARSFNSASTQKVTVASKFNLDRIFSKGAYNEISPEVKREITRQRNAELLIPDKVANRYISKIIFRSQADLKMALALYGNDPRFIVDDSKFYNENQYCKDYKIEVTENNIKCVFILNRGNIPYIRQFSHILMLKYRGYLREYDIFNKGGEIHLENNAYHVLISIPINNYNDLKEVEYLIDRNVSSIWRREND